jgi:alpha,alpha-trehalase
MRKLFPDGKTFVDATPRRPPAQILAAYRAHAAFTDAELKRFVRANFVVPESRAPCRRRPRTAPR